MAIDWWIFKSVAKVRYPRYSRWKELEKQVKLAVEIKQPLDSERLKSDNVNASLYISWETLFVETSLEWSEESTKLLEVIRNAPRVDSEMINNIFGLGSNDVRERAWKRILSGHLDVSTLKYASTSLKIFGNVVIMEIMATPSMKNEI